MERIIINFHGRQTSVSIDSITCYACRKENNLPYKANIHEWNGIKKEAIGFCNELHEYFPGYKRMFSQLSAEEEKIVLKKYKESDGNKQD